MQDEDHKNQVQNIVIKLLCDEQLEVPRYSVDFLFSDRNFIITMCYHTSGKGSEQYMYWGILLPSLYPLRHIPTNQVIKNVINNSIYRT